MPSNRIQINHSNELIWEVPDSRIGEIINLLNLYGELQPEPERQARTEMRINP